MTDLHDLVAPYALDALEPIEAENFERHLQECAACRDELAQLSDGVAELAASIAVAPPAALKERVMAGLDPPATVTVLKPKRRPGLTLVAIAAAVAIAFFGFWSLTNSQIGPSDPMDAVYAAADAQTMEIETSHGPVQFVYSPSLRQGVFDGVDLVEIDEGAVYQLWLIDADGPKPAGSMAEAAEVLVEGVDPGLTLAMTIEDGPGAEAPTSEPLFAASL